MGNQRHRFQSNNLYQNPSIMKSNESLSSGYNTDFLPVFGDTMDTEDYELWERRHIQPRHEATQNNRRDDLRFIKESQNVAEREKSTKSAVKHKMVMRNRARKLQNDLSDDEVEDLYHNSISSDTSHPF